MGAIIFGSPVKLRVFRSDKHHIRVGKFAFHRWVGILVFVLGFFVFMHGLAIMKANIWDIGVSAIGAILMFLGWKVIEPWRKTL